MNRRGFLNGILATAMAPAIVRSESLMKIWVPPQKLVLATGGFVAQAELAIIMEAIWLQHAKDIEQSIFYGTPSLFMPNPVRRNLRYGSIIDAVAQTTLK